ncbi:MAG: hypothetical protein RJA07_2143 [Bacteroidota bacterium]|jgi:hypothetical protein
MKFNLFLAALLTLAISNTNAQVVLMQDKIKLTQINETDEFPDAELSIKSMKIVGAGMPDTVLFNFDVKNYSLGNQTPDASQKRCANSAKGQHIHFIVDNKPYEALYKPEIKTTFAQGPHLVLAFLSRSYHQSIKSKKAYVLKQIKSGNTKLPDYDITKPMLFYSRPKAFYIGADTQNVLLDFYVVNTTISKKTNRVKATINGKIFMLNDWKPFLVQGLPMGITKIKLELVNKKGKLVEGAFTSIEREITLAASEPIKP